MHKIVNKISTITDFPFVEVNETGNKVGRTRIFINDCLSFSSEGSIGDAIGDFPSQNPFIGDIFYRCLRQRLGSGWL